MGAGKGIRAIAAGRHHVAGLTDQGTVVICGGRIRLGDGPESSPQLSRYIDRDSWRNTVDGLYDPEEWTDIAAIAAGYNCTIGVKRDGSVVFSDAGSLE